MAKKEIGNTDNRSCGAAVPASQFAAAPPVLVSDVPAAVFLNVITFFRNLWPAVLTWLVTLAARRAIPGFIIKETAI